jgi:hypothetical protein
MQKVIILCNICSYELEYYGYLATDLFALICDDFLRFGYFEFTREKICNPAMKSCNETIINFLEFKEFITIHETDVSLKIKPIKYTIKNDCYYLCRLPHKH